MANPTVNTDLTEGSTLKNIFRMGVPSAIGFFAANVNDFIDAIWVAKLGTSHVAAVTIFAAIFWVISSVNQLAGTGSVSIISQNYGNKDIYRTEAAIKETFLLKWGLAVFFGVIALIFLKDILLIVNASTKLLPGASETVHSLAMQYGTIMILGLGFFMCSYTNFTALRGIGNPQMAMILMIGTVVVNIILDPFLIFGWWIFPELGIRGAALASVIAYTISFLAGLVIFYSGKANVRLHLKSRIKVKLRTLWKIIRIGAPSGVNSVSFSLSRAIVLYFVGMTTTEAVAAYGIGGKVSHLSIMVIVGLGLGVAALIGQLLGAERPERAKATANQAIGVSLIITSIIAALTFIFAEPIMRIFLDPASGASEATVVSIGIKLLRIISLCLPAVGVYIIMEMTFSGAGNNVPPMVFGILTAWLLEVPMIIIALKVLNTSETGIWWALSISAIVGNLLCYWWFSKGYWLTKRVKGE